MSAVSLPADLIAPHCAAPVPVLLLTGFLGAGKTSLLNRLLRLPELNETGFIINEFGAVGIDDQLVETADESPMELMNGCLCCTIQGDLADRLAAMLRRGGADGRPLKRIIIETTGLADPGPIMQAILGAPFLQPYLRLEQIIAVLDAAQGRQTLSHYREARRQLAFADTILLSKTDLLAADLSAREAAAALAALEAAARELNPAAQICAMPRPNAGMSAGQFAAAEADFCRALLAGGSAGARAAKAGKADGQQYEAGGHNHHGSHHHAHNINRHSDSIFSLTLTAAEPLPLAAAEHFAYLLGQLHGDKILRLKAVIDIGESAAKRRGGPRYYSLQAAQGRVFPPQALPPRAAAAAEAAGPGSQIVIIADGVDKREIGDLFNACRSRPAADTPDYAALTNNPLAVPGFKF